MNRLKKFLIGALFVLGCLVLVGVFWVRDRYVVPILTYHNVSNAEGKGHLNNVTPQKFAWQMKFLKKNNYHVISFDDYVQGHNKGVAFARNTVIIHFDDGYEDNYTQAFPVLKSYGFPAMVFLVADKIGTKGYLSWDQVKEMEQFGFKAGSHTRSHAYLPDVDLATAKEEISGSKKKIEGRLGYEINYFVYPSGGYTDEIKAIVQQAGYKAAGTTNRGRDRFNRDLFELNRIRIKDSDNAVVLWAKLSGYYNAFRKNKFSKSEEQLSYN